MTAQVVDTAELCMVLDEKAIEYCGTFCKEVLAAVGNGCRSVVACRARKDQKAQMLNLIRDRVPGSCCLAIGDGANDVAMIRAGNIGVGIIGKEGMAAVNNSDFAIGQFRFLRGLLLVHGRFNYRRMSVFAVYMFYKNIANVLAMYFYTLTAMASGGRLFLTIYIELYNIVYTAFPIILFGISDQDVPKAVSAATPSLYTAGIHRVYYTHTSFWRWMLEATYTALVAAYAPIACLGAPGLSLATFRGDEEYHALAYTSMTLVVLCTNFRLALELHSWGLREHTVMWMTCPVFLELSLLVYSQAPFFFPSGLASFSWRSFHLLMPQLCAQPAWWLCVVLGVMLVIGPRFVAKAQHSIGVGSAVKEVRRQMRHADQQRHRNLRASLHGAFHAVSSSGRSKADLSVSEAAGAELTPPISPGARKPLCSAAAASSSSSNGRSDDEPATDTPYVPPALGAGEKPTSSAGAGGRKQSRIVTWSGVRGKQQGDSASKAGREGYAFSADQKTTNAIWNSMGLLPHIADELSLGGGSVKPQSGKAGPPASTSTSKLAKSAMGRFDEEEEAVSPAVAAPALNVGDIRASVSTEPRL